MRGYLWPMGIFAIALFRVNGVRDPSPFTGWSIQPTSKGFLPCGCCIRKMEMFSSVLPLLYRTTCSLRLT